MRAWTVNTVIYLLALASACLWTLLDKPLAACVFLLMVIAGFCGQIADNTKP